MSGTPSANARLPLPPPYDTNLGSDHAHYRLMYAFYTPYNEIKDMRNVVQSLQGATIALQQMWERFNYVHMDINLVTVRWDSNGKTGRLADFDYAVPIYHKPARMVETGASESTSIEANAGSVKLCYRDCFRTPSASRSTRPLPIRDLKSILWLSVWALLLREAPDCDNDDLLDHKANIALLFFGHKGFFRLEELYLFTRFRGKRSIPCLEGNWETFPVIRKGIGKITEHLCEPYRSGEEHPVEETYKTYITTFEDILGELGSAELPIKPTRQVALQLWAKKISAPKL